MMLLRPLLKARPTLQSVRRLYHHDYYDSLGVNRTASPHEVKVAYFRMAKKYHPDTNKTQEARFMFELVAEAYEVLSDPEKREEYNKTGKIRSRTGGTTSAGPTISRQDSTDSEKLFSKLFGQATGQRLANEYEETGQFNSYSYDGFDALRETILQISFDDAAMGATVPIVLNVRVICPKCDGDKSEMGYRSNICPYCEGTGLETERLGDMVSRKVCSYCDGTKLFVRFKCHECAGTGQTIVKFEMYVTIPPGTEDGQILRVPIHPDIMQYVINHHDHIFVKVDVQSHPFLKREGYDVHSQADVSVAQALLGGELFLEGIGGATVAVDVNVDSSHQTLVAPNLGIPRYECGRGSHFVEVGVKVPPQLSPNDRQKLISVFKSLIVENGFAEGCAEPEHSHKFKAGVVEPTNVNRNFAKHHKSMKERFELDEELRKEGHKIFK